MSFNNLIFREYLSFSRLSDNEFREIDSGIEENVRVKLERFEEGQGEIRGRFTTMEDLEVPRFGESEVGEVS